MPRAIVERLRQHLTEYVTRCSAMFPGGEYKGASYDYCGDCKPLAQLARDLAILLGNNPGALDFDLVPVRQVNGVPPVDPSHSE